MTFGDLMGIDHKTVARPFLHVSKDLHLSIDPQQKNDGHDRNVITCITNVSPEVTFCYGPLSDPFRIPFVVQRASIGDIEILEKQLLRMKSFFNYKELFLRGVYWYFKGYKMILHSIIYLLHLTISSSICVLSFFFRVFSNPGNICKKNYPFCVYFSLFVSLDKPVKLSLLN